MPQHNMDTVRRRTHSKPCLRNRNTADQIIMIIEMPYEYAK